MVKKANVFARKLLLKKQENYKYENVVAMVTAVPCTVACHTKMFPGKLYVSSKSLAAFTSIL